MATYDFEIYFFGLLGIYGTSIERNAPAGKTNALLLRDDDHTPVIFLNTTNRDYETTLTDHVSFDNLPKGESLIVPTFDTYVPHLVPLTRSSVKLYPNALGIKVTLPDGGLLAAVEAYPYEGKYILDQTVPYQGCIARLTLLQVTTIYPTVVVRYNGTTSEVDAKGFVFIGNREPYPSQHKPIATDVDSTGERPDFKKYYKITTGVAGDLATLYELKDKGCDPLIPNPPYIKAKHLQEARDIAFRVADHPECSNTQWP